MRSVWALAILLITGASRAETVDATVPSGVNYQGVLRDAADRPVDGTYDMVFRLYTASTGGTEILADHHTAALGSAVGVGGGLFNVVLGSGTIVDGNGPGAYMSLADVFRDHSQVFLEVQVSGQILLPRARIQASPYSFNADNLDGFDSAAFASAAHVHQGTEIYGPVYSAYTAQQLQGLEPSAFALAGHVHAAGDLVGPVNQSLDSDRLDGLDSTAFALAAHVHDGADLVGPVNQANQATNADKLDGMDSTAFAAAAHGHAGSEIVGPVSQAASATNADQLDGLDSSAFAAATHVHLGSELVGPVSHAATADAFSVDPAACAGGLFVTDVGSDGTLVCGGPAQGAGGQIQFADGSGALVASSAFTFDEASASLRVTRLETAVDNGVRHTTGFADIASALADVPAAGGVLFADSDEDDATPLHQTNPAQADGSSGKRASLVMDTRGGGLRLLSSMPEYPTGPTGADERRVPFVFQTRLEDHQQVYDDDGSGEEWNCGLDVARCTGDGATLCITDDDCARTVGGICPVAGEGVTDPGYEWKNCPYGNSSWGIAGGSRQYWHSGQCNVGASSQFGTSALCGGPHILEVRYPYTPGKMTSKPIFAVGNGGVSIFEPEYKSAYWRSFLTMFRADVGAKANHPMYVFDRDGFMADGGAFFGGSPFFPGYAGHTYTQFNAAVHHDILPQNPAFVVWGPMGSTTAAETGPAARFYDPSNGKFGFVHPQYEREAFGFYNHSRLYLGSYQDSNPSIEESQFIEWEGRVKDGSTTRLGLSAEPTAANFIALPNASGTLALEQSVVTLTGDQTVTGTKRFTGEVSVDGALRFGAGRGPQTCLARDPKGNALFIDANCDGALGADEVPLDRPRVEPERDLTCSTILALQADVTSLAEPGAQGAYSFVTADGSVPLLMPRAGVFHDLQVEVAGLEAPCAYEARLVVNDVETALGCDVGGNGLADCANGVERITSASRDKVRLSVRMAAHQGACSDRAEAITVSLCWSSSRPTE